MKNYLIEDYLTYISEREWTDPDDEGAIHPDLVKKVLGTLTGSAELAKMRQIHQPKLLNIYVKNALGDYRGRADTLNSYRFKKIGFKDWQKIKAILMKAYEFEKKLNPAELIKHIRTVQNLSGEPLGKEIGPDGISDDGYSDVASDGGDGGDGGGGE